MFEQQTLTRTWIDIGSVVVRRELPRNERILDFAQQLGGDPYHFLCNGFKVTVSYAGTGATIEDRLRGIVG